MKLDRLMSCAFAAAAVALACGCSTTAVVARPSAVSAAPPVAVVDDATATTSLMSADLPGPAPRVGKLIGKSHGTVGALEDVGDAAKEARPSDGSRRSGAFGTTK